eukprot:GHVP01048474.1.p1 GENE.GHVP01048474.1~~GHVP01048474.1.p1  ORF type:complete len:188 (+),score=28.45 GHVP01048474.1:40-603(+)
MLVEGTFTQRLWKAFVSIFIWVPQSPLEQHVKDYYIRQGTTCEFIFLWQEIRKALLFAIIIVLSLAIIGCAFISKNWRTGVLIYFFIQLFIHLNIGRLLVAKTLIGGDQLYRWRVTFVPDRDIENTNTVRQRNEEIELETQKAEEADLLKHYQEILQEKKQKEEKERYNRLVSINEGKEESEKEEEN